MGSQPPTLKGKIDGELGLEEEGGGFWPWDRGPKGGSPVGDFF